MSGPEDADRPPGGRYEAALPADERRADGQFYTPPSIARALVEWALPAPTDERAPSHRDDRLPRVLDPAAGAGAFALATYDRLASAFGADPRAALDRVTLVDVNERPLSLAAEALADRAGVTPDAARTRATSFFDCKPGDFAASGGPGRRSTTGGPGPSFDAVVGNPPFVRHEDLADKEHYRAHLAALGPDGATPYHDGDRALSGRSDASAYFLTHATRFVHPGGRLAFVAPRKWLTARYGESLRAFVADHYRVAAVAAFPDRVFEGALVDTLLVLLERRADPGGPARLIGLAGRPDAESLVAAAHGRPTGRAGRGPRPDGHRAEADGTAGPTVVEGAEAPAPVGSRLVDLPRRRFREAAKLAHYLDAPAPVLELVEADGLAPLGSVADVTYGYKTGANDFFFLAPDDRERWPVADRFLAPAVTSLRQVAGRDVRAADVETAVLDVHDYVASVLGDAPGDAGGPASGGASGARSLGPRDGPADPAAAVKAALARDGHETLRSYVERGERRGYHERSTCAARQVWFDLGALDPPAVLHPKFFDERVVVARNRDGLIPSNAIDCLALREGVDPAALLGALNSTLHRTLLECFGRAEGGGALQLMTYELEAVPVLDVPALSAEGSDRVARAFESLVAASGESAAGAALDRLDRAVLDALGADVSVGRLGECRRTMVERRVGATAGDG